MVAIAIGSVFFKMAMKASWSHEKIAVATFASAAVAILVPYLFKVNASPNVDMHLI
jgi:uncharacterized membrane protein